MTLICRPWRFGKTLNLDTVYCFLSTEYAGRGDELFGGLDVWRDPSMRAVQGTVPVVYLSFANAKLPDYASMMKRFNRLMCGAVDAHRYLRGWDGLSENERESLAGVTLTMDAETCANVPNLLCSVLKSYWGVVPVVLIDEYDTPMHEAWTNGYWDVASSFMRDLMNTTFKASKPQRRGLITGITRVAKESIFSDLNNFSVITTSTERYQDAFGFTEDEVASALVEYGLEHELERVCAWYDGFTLGGKGSIYNPYSIVRFLDAGGIYSNYWANSSSNELISEVVRTGDVDIKGDFELLLAGGLIEKVIKEDVVFSQHRLNSDAVWALLLATGYVTVPGDVPRILAGAVRPLTLTNHEVRTEMRDMVETWFAEVKTHYSAFARAILTCDAREATMRLREITEACISSFDAGTGPSRKSEPERFYHGLVLGMLVNLRKTHAVESNRESGYGRYDVALVPHNTRGTDPAIVIEFKVFGEEVEQTLADTVRRAYDQIDKKCYVAGIVERGVPIERIFTYGIAFRGKEVLVG